MEHAGSLALLRGTWKYIPPSGGRRVSVNTATELGNDTVPQLYDLAADPGETRNVAAEEAAIVADLTARLDAIRQAGGLDAP